MGAGFTERELDIMAVLWARGPSTAADVRAALDDAVTHNTVQKMLSILEEKGHAAHIEEGRMHRFHALVAREEAGSSAFGRLIDKMFAGSAEAEAPHADQSAHALRTAQRSPQRDGIGVITGALRESSGATAAHGQYVRDEVCTRSKQRVAALCIPVGVNERATRHLDTPLLVACAVMALLAVTIISLAIARQRRMAATLERADVLDTPVLVSRDIGPALLGVFRYTIVLPRWTLELPAADLRTILTHEHQHTATRDPALLLCGLLLVALQPWNVALWMAWSRLRLATELDCDARVLASQQDARAYGHVLVRVYERSAHRMLPLSALVSRRSHLETRIRRMMERPRRTWSLTTVCALVCALVGVLAAGTAAVTFDVTAQRSSPRGSARGPAIVVAAVPAPAPATAPATAPVPSPTPQSLLRPTTPLLFAPLQAKQQPVAPLPSTRRQRARAALADNVSSNRNIHFFVNDSAAEPARVVRIALDDITAMSSSNDANRVEIRISTVAADAPQTSRDSLRRRSDSMTLFVAGYRLRFYASRHMPIAR